MVHLSSRTDQATKLPIVRDVWVPMSYEEWLHWEPDNVVSEWVDGKGIIFVSASEEHQLTVALMYSLLMRFAALYDLGRVMLAPYHVRLWEDGPAREPDVLFLAKEHLNRWTRTRILGGIDLAVEMISPDSVHRDLVDKVREYALAGVREYLLIDIRPGLYSFRLLRLDADGVYQDVAPDGQGRVSFSVLPGFWLDPDWFRQMPLPDAEGLLMEIAGDEYWNWLLAKRRAQSGH